MAVRATMADLIALVRLKIADTSITSPQFTDQAIQDSLDQNRDDIRYEALQIAPSLVNTVSTGNQAQTIYADYYSKYGCWEADVILQGFNNGAAWQVVTPVSSELLLDQAHFQFESTPFVSGTVPGQLPPLFATGKVYDPNAAAADLLQYWAATLAGSYDISVDGQNLRRSQMMQAKLTMADFWRRRARAKTVKMIRPDVAHETTTRNIQLFGDNDVVRGAL